AISRIIRPPPASPRQRALVDEVAAPEVLDLLGRRAAAEGFVAMGMAAEAREHRAIRAGLARRELEPPTDVGRRAGHLVGEPEALGVAGRQEEEKRRRRASASARRRSRPAATLRS